MKLKLDRKDVAAVLASIPASKPDAKIYLVKDEGIYLMSFDSEKPANATKDWLRPVAYAKGYNPTLGEDVYDSCREAVGGDDFGEVCGTKHEFDFILSDSFGDILVNVTTSSIAVSYTPKSAAPKAWKPLDVFKGAKSGKWRVVYSIKADGTPVLYGANFAKKSDASKFVKALKTDATFKAMHDDVAKSIHKAVA